eukprot:9131652-Pyramimonas_sp.AAC.1
MGAEQAPKGPQDALRSRQAGGLCRRPLDIAYVRGPPLPQTYALVLDERRLLQGESWGIASAAVGGKSEFRTPH